MFRAAKDSVTSEAARRYANNLVARYGEVVDLKIDSGEKTVRAVCRLTGEQEPITVTIESYEVLNVGGKKMLRLGRCRCSRPWLEALLNDFAKGREVEVPGWASMAL